MLRFACPFCHFQISVSESDAGGRIVCPACGKTVAIPATRFDNGCIIGDFIIQSRIGAGAAGTVFLAQQISLEREVALKVLSHKNMTEKGVATFLNEARAAAKLSHVNLVQSYAVGEDDGYSYMAMTYIRGETLKSRLKREKRIPIDEALHIVQQIAEALCYAWNESRLIHRDVKPDNIMLTDDGIAKLTDLGLAMNQKDWSEDMDISGSPSYMSPEQFAGEPLDTRSDIYSLGVTLYQMITGSLPFRAVSISMLANQHFNQKPEPPERFVPGLPATVSALIKKMMAKKPSKRFADMEELLDAIWRLRQLTAPSRSLIPDVHTISIRRLNYGIQTEYVNNKRRQERIQKKQRAEANKPRFAVVLLVLVTLVLLAVAAAWIFTDFRRHSFERSMFANVDAFERLVATPEIPLERLTAESEALAAEFAGKNDKASDDRIGRYVFSHINYLLVQRSDRETPSDGGAAVSSETTTVLENQISLLNDEIANLKTKVVPRLKEEIEAAVREGEAYHSELISAQHDLVKSKADFNALNKTREEELAASDELKINTMRQRLYQLIVTQRFSLARQMLTTEQLRSPRLESWCLEMMRRINFLDRVYAVFSGDDADLETVTQEEALAAYAGLYGDDGRTSETILCAFEALRGNYDKAAHLRPEDPEIPATANAVAEELVSAARTLHTMGEKKLPAMFAKTMSQLPKTAQTTAAASTINVLFPGFPLKN
ncbi:MAG: protein kinase [Lentisphaeria bacterium]|nr:protein kinase [Lentisphaeria bacterium]